MTFEEAMVFMRYGYAVYRENWEENTRIIYMDDFEKIVESKYNHEDKYTSAYWPVPDDINAHDWRAGDLKTEWRSEC